MSAIAGDTTPLSGISDMDDKSSYVTPDGTVKFFSDIVKEPSENDVLCGRGGSINSHPGNERFRQLVEKRKRVYLTARFKREKRLIASSIVSEIRALKPPGRFLSRDTKSGMWKDIGDEKARDKTSQALRENAPSIRAEIETEISEKRTEMQRDEEEVPVVTRVTSAQHPPPPPYYQPGWGYHSYYGYTHHAPPPPGHPMPPHTAVPPPPYPHYDPATWPHHSYPYGPPPPHYPPPLQPPPAQPQTKSALEQTAELVSSGAEQLKNWTKASFSFGGVTTSPSEGHDNRSIGGHSDSRSAGSAGSRPIVYVHNDDNKKRRIVKFRDDKRCNRRKFTRQANGANSLVEGMSEEECNEQDDHDLEPQKLDAPDNQSTLLSLFPILNSWDAATIVCGHDNTDERVPFPASHGGRRQDQNIDASLDFDDMAVEWEGQEVQLLGEPEYDSVASEDRMPPPVVRPRNADQASSIGFSSLGSCHSWIPEQLGSAASYFTGYKSGVSPANSMEMEFSTAGTENYSANGSLGGASLTKVFENDAEFNTSVGSPQMSHRSLMQIPSWERSLRSKSPLSIGSDDDESLISKASSKISDGHLSPIHYLGDEHDETLWDDQFRKE